MSSWSWRIGRVAGIDLYVHFTFVFLLAWVALANYLPNRDPLEAVWGMIFILALFGVVVLHELGHALVARRYGIRTRDITLLPIGGVARLERMPDDPKQELLVALAGPAVNVLLAAGIYVLLTMRNGLSTFADATGTNGDLLNQLFYVNIALAVFNMLPAFPMDGGRVLRALLAMRFDYVRATRIAASLGQSMAVVLGVIGLFFNPFLVLIAIFVWLGAGAEAGVVQMQAALDGIPVRRAMITDFKVLQPDDRLSLAAEHLIAGFQQDFPVVDVDGRLLGVLTREDLVRGLSTKGPQATVGKFMQVDFVPTDPREMLHTAFLRLGDCHCRSLPVVEKGRLVGLLTSDNVAEVFLIRQALAEARGEGGAGVAAPADWRRATRPEAAFASSQLKAKGV